MDDGEPVQLSSTTRVIISVQDVNDNAPEFDQKTYNVEIPSNVKINQKVFQVSLRLSYFINLHLRNFNLYTHNAIPYINKKEKVPNDL